MEWCHRESRGGKLFRECASLPPPPLRAHTHTHTYLLSGTIHAELHAPPVTRPHFPLPINPDLSHKQQEGVEEEGGSSLNHWEKTRIAPKTQIKIQIYFWVSRLRSWRFLTRLPCCFIFSSSAVLVLYLHSWLLPVKGPELFSLVPYCKCWYRSDTK